MSVRTRLLFSAIQLAIGMATVPALAQTALAQTALAQTALAQTALAQTAAAPAPPAGGRMIDRFDAANTTHDGRLTLAQAQAANMRGVARNFSSIDARDRGYVTIDDLRAYNKQRRASRASAQPAASGNGVAQ